MNNSGTIRKYIDILTESQELVITNIKTLERVFQYGEVKADVFIDMRESKYSIIFPKNFTVHGDLILSGNVRKISGDLTVNKDLELSDIDITEIDCNIKVNGSLDIEEGLDVNITNSLKVKGNFRIWGEVKCLPDNTYIGGHFQNFADYFNFPKTMSIGQYITDHYPEELPGDLIIRHNKITLVSFTSSHDTREEDEREAIQGMEDLNPQYAGRISWTT